MLATHWPLFGLTVTRGSVTLRLPTDDEAADLAGVAADGVHAEGERPFLTPWTERGARSRSRFVLQERWRELAGGRSTHGASGWASSWTTSRSGS